MRLYLKERRRGPQFSRRLALLKSPINFISSHSFRIFFSFFFFCFVFVYFFEFGQFFPAGVLGADLGLKLKRWLCCEGDPGRRGREL